MKIVVNANRRPRALAAWHVVIPVAVLVFMLAGLPAQAAGLGDTVAPGGAAASQPAPSGAASGNNGTGATAGTGVTGAGGGTTTQGGGTGTGATTGTSTTVTTTTGTGAGKGTVASPGFGKWIDVNLRTQTLVAYVGRTPVFSTRISSGVAKHPTVVGTYHVYTKLTSQRMTGGVGREHYDLPNVPNVMYFYSGYGIHGTYWHHNFGHPMSHGCVNASLAAAAWLFQWTPVGTPVTIHY